MSILHKEYWNIGGNEIKASIRFNRETVNLATFEPKKVGYQVTCVPVKRSKCEGGSVEEFGAFTGFNDNLIEVERQSAKRLQTAITELRNRKEKYLQYFKERYDWKDIPAE